MTTFSTIPAFKPISDQIEEAFSTGKKILTPKEYTEFEREINDVVKSIREGLFVIVSKTQSETDINAFVKKSRCRIQETAAQFFSKMKLEN